MQRSDQVPLYSPAISDPAGLAGSKRWEMLDTIINCVGKSAPASERGIDNISARGEGRRMDPSAAKSSGDAGCLHTKSTAKDGSGLRAGGFGVESKSSRFAQR